MEPMKKNYIETIRTLAKSFRDNERNLTLHFPDFETPPDYDSYNRVFGPPIGLTDDRWPTFSGLGELLQKADCIQHWDPRDTRMEHVFTVDLRDVELLGAPTDAEAMMLFISNATLHGACRDGNQHTQVLFLRREDLDRGLYQGQLPQRSLYRWSRRFSLVPVEVPGDVFDVPQLGLDDDDPLVDLFEAISLAPARLGGCPIWVRGKPAANQGWSESTTTVPWQGSKRPPHQSSTGTLPYEGRKSAQQGAAVLESSRTVPFDPHAMERRPMLTRAGSLLDPSGDPADALTFGRQAASPSLPPTSPFLMQFQRRFAEVNLGNQGVMYVSGGGAYVQSH